MVAQLQQLSCVHSPGPLGGGGDPEGRVFLFQCAAPTAEGQSGKQHKHTASCFAVKTGLAELSDLPDRCCHCNRTWQVV